MRYTATQEVRVFGGLQQSFFSSLALLRLLVYAVEFCHENVGRFGSVDTAVRPRGESGEQREREGEVVFSGSDEQLAGKSEV